MLTSLATSTVFLSLVALGAVCASASLLGEGQQTPPAATPPAAASPAAPANLYAIKTTTLEGKPFDFGAQREKVLLIVNVASKCGYTPQYAQLEKLHQKYKDRGLVVIGVPSNDFGGQEPGSSEEIRDFCTKNYGVTFPLTEKMRTTAGDDQSELYRVLESRATQLPTWNFCKYLVTRDGKAVTFYASKVAPDSAELTAAIEAALGPATAGEG